YAAAGIAKSDPMTTGWTACRIGLAAFIIPYMFVFNPSLLMQGKIYEILWIALTAFVGTSLLACSTIGWFITNLSSWERFLIFASSVSLIEPRLKTDVLALIFFAPVLINQIRIRKKIRD
ncbi:MAG: TRAP transporter permease, partial [Deltaproteobacteria bacterium]|nr:TRAP transporter permease [Deltaproteobacteria bacterium]